MATVTVGTVEYYDRHTNEGQTRRKSGAQSYGANEDDLQASRAAGMSQRRFVIGAELCIPISGRPTMWEIAMTKSGTHVLTAAVALLALVSPMAHGLDANATTYYASVAPSAFERLTPTAKPVPVAAEKKPRLQKKRKGSKAKILAGLNSFRSPARRALDRLEHSERDCRVGASACPAVVRNGRSHGQEWTHTALRRPATAANETPTEGAAADPGLARPHTDVPGLVPGRESSYKLSLNLPLGRHENVLLQANVRKNVYNAQNSSDSTLRADWSLRF